LRPLLLALARPHTPFDALLEAHQHAAEALAASEDAPGTELLWSGHAGSALARELSALRREAPHAGALDSASYEGILDYLLTRALYQPPQAGHPRLHILSPMEARMHLADVVILGGMNEGNWPSAPTADPWLSREMRAALGLPREERAVGQAAHDFEMLAHARHVLITRARKQGGTPTLPSRWVLRLKALASALRLELPASPWAEWGRQLFHAPQSDSLRLAAPRATPPLAARPRTLWVTRIETLLRDPYGFYAQHILRLRPLDPLDDAPSVRLFGEAVHRALELYVRACPDHQPPDALPRLLEAGRQAFHDLFRHAQAATFWWPRFERIAHWYVEEERRRRAEEGLRSVTAEACVERGLEVAQIPYVLRARIDRQEHYADGSLLLADYKTGTLPTVTEVLRGVACQIPLEAWLLSPPGSESRLRAPEYWRLSGERLDARIHSALGQNTSFAHHPSSFLQRTEAGLRTLLELFSREESAYLACPDPDIAPRHNDYAHLERIDEWAA
jgi:ATP-dependent helicase/nuclease subunit B